MKIKKKICNECKKETYIFSKGRCKPCANNEYARRGIENQRAKERKPRKAKNYRIPRVSKSMLKKLAEYRPLRDAYMSAHEICEVKGCNRKSQDLHHVARRGKNLCNVDTFLAVCRECHIYIEDNPIESKKLGYLK